MKLTLPPKGLQPPLFQAELEAGDEPGTWRMLTRHTEKTKRRPSVGFLAAKARRPIALLTNLGKRGLEEFVCKKEPMLDEDLDERPGGRDEAALFGAEDEAERSGLW